MAPLNLEGLEFKRIKDVPGVEIKLSEFLDSLTVETETWRDFETRNGHRIIPHPIDGYACLDGDKIVGINYFILPRKNSLTYFIHKIFKPKEAEVGVVIKKEYQGRGINSSIRILKFKLMIKQGYTYGWGYGDPSNVARIKSIQKARGYRLIEKNGVSYAYWDLRQVVDDYEKKSD